jgi:hypothetical protein
MTYPHTTQGAINRHLWEMKRFIKTLILRYEGSVMCASVPKAGHTIHRLVLVAGDIDIQGGINALKSMQTRL